MVLSRGKQAKSWIGIGALVMAGGLMLTNPTPADFQDFAAQRLVQLVEQELCQKPALPMLLQMVIQNCSAMVQAQQTALGQLATEHSRRLNLGLASLYSTSFGGQQLLPNWRLPRYEVSTLAVAGQFVVLNTSSTP
ncbi:MAG: DUF4359 domain-containing protein [Cyanobacteriota bacterium]|nr:DUF4359 domain-containing protein [Cyanobacteriota bacterium]